MRLLILLLLITLKDMPSYGQVMPAFSARNTLIRYQHIIDSIVDEGAIRFRGYGSGVVPGSAYHSLKKQATNEDLILLTEYPQPAVRCYAFMAVVERGDTAAFHILLNHLDDRDAIEVMGCTEAKMPCAAFFLNEVVSWRTQTTAESFRLNADQMAYVDSILIFTQPVLLARGRMNSLLLLPPIPSYYEQIKRIVTEEQDPAAAVALLKYHKEQDRIIIRQVISRKRNAYFLKWFDKLDQE